MRSLPHAIQHAPPFESFLGDLASLDVKHSQQDGTRFAVIAARSNPRWWLLPLEDRRATVSGLEMLQPVSRAATVAKTAARTMARFGPHRFLGRGQIRLSGLTDQPNIMDAFDGRAVHLACFTGTDGPHRKTALQIMDGSGAILGYAKLTRADHIRPYLRNESETLRRVAAMQIRSADVPAVLALRDDDAVTMLITDSVKSANHAAPLVPGSDHLAFLAELRTHTHGQGASQLLDDLAAQTDALSEVMGSDWAARLKQAIRVLRPDETTIPLCMAHGDFTPWNTFLQGGRLYVFDWEYAQPSWPVGFDLSHFLLSTMPPASQANGLDGLIAALADAHFGADRIQATRGLLLSLVCHAVFYLQRLREGGSILCDWTEGPARAALIDLLLASGQEVAP